MRPGVRSTEDQAAAGRRRRTASTMALFTWAVMLRLLSEEVEHNLQNTGWEITITRVLLQIGLTAISGHGAVPTRWSIFVCAANNR